MGYSGKCWLRLSAPAIVLKFVSRLTTGSLTESTQQSGFSHAIPRIALTQSGGLDAAQARSLWQQGFDPKRPMPPVIVSYDSTLYNLSLPNNR
ncbi:hypothetical protein LFZ31_27095 [Salmonella enterica subsp. enterica serovar Newport str. S09097]|nr:hypothetical protein LFZ31_27095 [Salmonella enterica subsp. enterica serovar Newport str. S09097]